jgi:uncharacterized membrane protein YfcA
MRKGEKIYQMLVAAAIAHAKWDYGASMNIIRSKKKLVLLGLLFLPCVLFAMAEATDQLPGILGGHKAYSPAFSTPRLLWVSTLIGLMAGLITGCIGAGGGFIITPALMSAGVKGILSVGTDLFHIFAKAIMGTTIHKKLGNVSVGLAVAFVLGSFIGVTCGGAINRAIYQMSPLVSDCFITIVYVFLLGFLGCYAMTDFLRNRKGDLRVGARPGESPKGDMAATGKKGLPARLQSVTIPPSIRFDKDLVPGGKKISAWFVAICGFFVGLAAAIMGVGGGFLTFPMFVYILGVSSFTTVGTDILQIIFTAGYASIGQYAIYGFIFYSLAMGLLVGSLLGIQIGALVTKTVKGIYIRGFYATAILAGFLNRLFALPGKLGKMQVTDIFKPVSHLLDQIGIYVFFLVIGLFGIWVLTTFLKNIRRLREA